MVTPLCNAQSLDQRTAVGQFVQTERRVDEGILLLGGHCRLGQLAEFRRYVVRAGERLLAASRVSRSTEPSRKCTSMRTLCRAPAPSAVIAGSCTTITLR